ANHLRAAGAPVAVDLCTGSGAIACFLAAQVPGVRVLATELDPAALAWAARNTDRLLTLRGAPHAGARDPPLPGLPAGEVAVLPDLVGRDRILEGHRR